MGGIGGDAGKRVVAVDEAPVFGGRAIIGKRVIPRR